MMKTKCKKGQHFFKKAIFQGVYVPPFSLFRPNSINIYNCRVRFDASCFTAPDVPMHHVDRWDLNKLPGISFDWHHHLNSVRMAWVVDAENNIQLWTYIRREGKIDWASNKWCGTITQGYPELEYSIVFNRSEGTYSMCIQGRVKYQVLIQPVPRTSSPYWYSVGPYHGGDLTAPCDMEMEVRMAYF